MNYNDFILSKKIELEKYLKQVLPEVAYLKVCNFLEEKFRVDYLVERTTIRSRKSKGSIFKGYCYKLKWDKLIADIDSDSRIAQDFKNCFKRKISELKTLTVIKHG